LLVGTPRGWLEPGKTIEVREAPTLFGETSFRCESRAAGNEIVTTIDPPHRKPGRVVLHVRPPSKTGLAKAVTVNGRPWTNFKEESIDLGRLKARTVVACRY
jgi:hypothetical protein